MKADLYTSAGKKKGSIDLPSTLFEAPINEGLMHFALLMQQANRRIAIAHTKGRGEVRGSTRKLFKQKGTGRARRGSIRANLMKGGAKSFGPKSDRNFSTGMPKKMRRRALFSSLSQAAVNGKVIALEGYGEDYKTKTFVNLLSNLPVAVGRKIVFVLPAHMEALERGASNVPGVKTILAPYLNPEDVLGAYHLVFLEDAITVAEETFGGAVSAERRAGSSENLTAPSSKPTATKHSQSSSPKS